MEQNPLPPDSDIFASRRRLFKWAGRVVAGASLVGLGLGSTKSAFAEPNCYRFCTGCTVNSCQLSGSCEHSGQGNYFITFTYQSGCEPGCHSQQASRCSVSCSC